ncbi:Transcriptional activator spt7 [Podospora pseudocomata]|uniref:Transcriptional activator spt7 n=1 Tax=Podospora pseudocomata TaxID=2093779 RepID=A0ABR0GD53_9PEZI|nr:Transcriptional activator spt7 [Podospora pseudocomata]
MSIANGQNAWPPPSASQVNGDRGHGYHGGAADDGLPRTNTPSGGHHPPSLMPEASDLDDEHRRALFAQKFQVANRRLEMLFGDDGGYDQAALASFTRPPTPPAPFIPAATDHAPIQEPPRKRAKRVIDEDDYGDDDDDDDDNDDDVDEESQDGANRIASKHSSAAAAKTLLSPSKSGSSPVHSVPSPGKQSREDGSQQKVKSSEDARKELEDARTATEEAAKRSFHTLFYTLENDRTAMLEHQQLEESEKQLQAEMDKTGHNSTSQPGSQGGHGSLSNANLGASSLTLKHLIARIDLKRDQVRASDAELRSLMNEVRKNRSKWASEENVGQEELYEALDKVLSELKAHTEFSTPFLNRVNKRDAPDYYNIIRQPMDMGTMTKKLKQLQYKSKTEFVTDLNLIWDNCLRYNQDMAHPFRRLANSMRKEAEKLIPLIPDVVIRPRAEVEAEERRKQNGGDDEDSDDEPIMSSRGRKATKGASKSRKAQSDQKEDTPNVETKPVLQLNGLLARHREGSEIDGSNGFGTPPVAGSITPSGLNGHHSGVSNADAMDIDGPSLNGIHLNQALGEAAEQAFEDDDYKMWKQVTKKDRALIAKERYRLFADGHLNVDEPALLRTKAGMRRFLKSQREAEAHGLLPGSNQADASAAGSKDGIKASETLAEGMEDDVVKNIPAYYEPQTIIPDIDPKLQWVEDGEGQVINQFEDMLQLVPQGHFISPMSKLTNKFDANIRQMQETRKLCSKISVIKQMQIQTQMYQNQFQKYNPEPFIEQDIEPHFLAGQGPVMAGEVCRAAMQRSVAKIFYHAGFEELQPSALDTITDIAGDYFQKLVRTFNVYREAELKPATGVFAERGAKFQRRYTPEEVILHTLDENGYDIEQLEAYARDDVGKLGSKLSTLHERMKAHLADLLRPALNDAGADGSGAFNDGSEQFVGGDFAEDLGEDFFGFKSLGLDKELGLDMLSVPLHLLQSRVRNQFQLQTQTAGAGVGTVDMFEPLPPSEPVTRDSIQEQIGLVKNFFLAKLHANGDAPLVEDEDLPVKQRRPRPRLGATGKIVSPQKRPPKEQIALAKKKKKMESSGLGMVTAGQNAGSLVGGLGGGSPNKSRKVVVGGGGGGVGSITLPTVASGGGESGTEKEDGGGTQQAGGSGGGMGMMSPDSMDVR